jgi:isoleucyl-tRNA synthetase
LVGGRGRATRGRAARDEVRIRVRQPLGVLYAVTPRDVEVGDDLLEILRDELNVRRVEFMHRAEELVTFSARPNFRALGARHGKRTPRVAEAIRALTSPELAPFVRGEPLEVEVDGERVAVAPEELEVVQQAQGELAVQAEGGYTVALDPALTPELRAEGLARELVNRVQRLRKDAGLEVSDRIRLGVEAGEELRGALQAHRDFVMGETLAMELELAEHALVPTVYEAVREVDLDGVAASIGLARLAQGAAV